MCGLHVCYCFFMRGYLVVVWSVADVITNKLILFLNLYLCLLDGVNQSNIRAANYG
jgi:hypothetical protein